VIGTLAAREAQLPVEVVTGDRDLFQLVRSEPSPVSVIYVGKGWTKAEVLGPAEVAARYGLPAEHAGAAYADMAMLRGDPSDGLPGVPGIGEMTAAKLVTRFGSLEALVAAARDGHLDVPPPARTNLVDASDYLASATLVVLVVTDYMAMLRGEPSDGLPGVPGIGEKTAAKLVTRFGSLEALVAAARDGHPDVPPRARTKLVESSDYLAAAPLVVRVATDAPVIGVDDDHVPHEPVAPERVAELAERY